MSTETKSFEVLAKDAGLKQVSITKLAEEDFDNVAAIIAMNDDDVRAIGLTCGQLQTFDIWRSELRRSHPHTVTAVDAAVNRPSSAVPSTAAQTSTATPADLQSQPPAASDTTAGSAVPQPVDTRQLSRDQEVQRLLDLLTAKSPAVGGLWPGADSPSTMDIREDNRPAGTSKVLLIPDFVSRSTHGTYHRDEQELCMQGGTQLLLLSSRQKPQPENVSLAQWISANARIMASLITEGKLSSQQQLLDYLQYTQDFGD